MQGLARYFVDEGWQTFRLFYVASPIPVEGEPDRWTVEVSTVDIGRAHNAERPAMFRSWVLACIREETPSAAMERAAALLVNLPITATMEYVNVERS